MFLVFQSQGYLVSLTGNVKRRISVVGTVFIQIFPQQGKAVFIRNALSQGLSQVVQLLFFLLDVYRAVLNYMVQLG